MNMFIRQNRQNDNYNGIKTAE